MSIEQKYIVLFGETGSGKSTFINYLVNYFHRGDLDNPCIAIPNRFYAGNMGFVSSENFVNDPSRSQTNDCHQYTFESENIKFHFIDTPGINDTGGHLQDNKNLEKFFTFIQQIPHIDAFILIMNGAQSRYTVNIRNVLSKIKERVPNVIYKNMFIILTNCYSYTVNFKSSSIGLSDQNPVFYMQNSGFSSDSRTWPPETRISLNNEFQNSMKTIRLIIDEILKQNPQSTDTFKNMNDDHNRLKRELHNARLAFMDLQQLDDELSQFELVSNIHRSNKEKFKNFIQDKEITVNVRVKTDYHNTICSKCNKVCHEDCQLDEIPFIGHTNFMQCKAMHSGKCTQCYGQCKATDHYHDRSKFIREKQTIKQVVNKLEQRYNEAVLEQSHADMKCRDIQEAKKMIDFEIENQYKNIKEILEHMQQTCNGLNVTNELYDFIIELKKDVTVLKSNSVIERAQIFISKLEQLCDDFNRIKRSNSDYNIQSMSSSIILTNNDDSSKHHSLDLMSKKSVKPMLSLSRRQESSNLLLKSPIDNDTSVFNYVDKTRETKIDKREDTKDNTIMSHYISSKKKLQTIEQQQQSNCDNEWVSKNFETYTLDQLIVISKEIHKELKNRCLGKTLGLLSNEEHIELCEQYSRLQSQQQGIVSIQQELEKEILDEIENNPFNIERIDRMKIKQLAAVNLLLQSSDNITTNNQSISSTLECVLSDNNIDFGLMPTEKLLSEYYSAHSNKDHRLIKCIFDELKCRCHGDYPLLIQEKRALFNELCKKYRNTSLDILKSKIIEIESKIDQKLEGDFARIDKIRKELILEAAAVNYLIDPKRIRIFLIQNEIKYQ